ncbi:hypothetical protein NQ117_15655 [Paenibacillus sp. SC116]|uniref:hypothetical protein n=1 Tax=Paenibacillus sp. SC116 TaxID=2968986 RepID=UPI00215A8B85|nr:hypothetical protein [Paenibacillus sp. SC116]MCR8845118.1 hypothetical protein [Paenibacillus sp. SC116]
MLIHKLRSVLIRSLPALVHMVLTLLFIQKLYTYENFDLTIVLFALITVNFIATSLVSKGQWRQLIISFSAFFIYMILYVFLVPLLGGLVETDSDNPGDGFTAMFGISISLIALVIGTLLGIVVNSLRNQIKIFFGKV